MLRLFPILLIVPILTSCQSVIVPQSAPISTEIVTPQAALQIQVLKDPTPERTEAPTPRISAVIQVGDMPGTQTVEIYSIDDLKALCEKEKGRWQNDGITALTHCWKAVGNFGEYQNAIFVLDALKDPEGIIKGAEVFLPEAMNSLNTSAVGTNAIVKDLDPIRDEYLIFSSLNWQEPALAAGLTYITTFDQESDLLLVYRIRDWITPQEIQRLYPDTNTEKYVEAFEQSVSELGWQFHADRFTDPVIQARFERVKKEIIPFVKGYNFFDHPISQLDRYTFDDELASIRSDRFRLMDNTLITLTGAYEAQKITYNGTTVEVIPGKGTKSTPTTLRVTKDGQSRIVKGKFDWQMLGDESIDTEWFPLLNGLTRLSDGGRYLVYHKSCFECYDQKEPNIGIIDLTTGEQVIDENAAIIISNVDTIPIFVEWKTQDGEGYRVREREVLTYDRGECVIGVDNTGRENEIDTQTQKPVCGPNGFLLRDKISNGVPLKKTLTSSITLITGVDYHVQIEKDHIFWAE